MPEMSSRTVRTMASMAFCRSPYIGMPLRETSHTTSAMNGSTDIITKVSTGSIVMVMQMPPISRIGARMPSRCIMPMTWLTL